MRSAPQLAGRIPEAGQTLKIPHSSVFRFDTQKRLPFAAPACHPLPSLNILAAYIQKLLYANDVDKASLGLKADQAYDRALEIDDHHWHARFSRRRAMCGHAGWSGIQSRTICASV